MTSRSLFINQSVLADFDDRKKALQLRLVAFQARVIINIINNVGVLITTDNMQAKINMH